VKVDQRLVDAAVALLERRFPGEGGVAAALYTEDGTMWMGVNFDPEWGGGGLCAETGPICQAYTLDKRVTASACVGRLDGQSPIMVLAPCGICQERLVHWGMEVEVAVADPADPTRWMARSLREVYPYYWVDAYSSGPGSRKVF
jgi:cytidine deaminase